MNTYPNLDKSVTLLENKLEPYIEDDSYVYKSCLEWIVVLQKLDSTITNEDRKDIKYSMSAKHRANMLKVVDIIHKFSDEQCHEITNSVHLENKITYKIGNIVKVNDYDTNINEVCSTGIHYFRDPLPAFYYELIINKIVNGKYISFYDNGQKERECKFINGQYNGKYIKWYIDGKKQLECTFNNGQLDGAYISWYNNGKLHQKYNYINGNLSGKCINWLLNEQKYEERNYHDGKLNGVYFKWFDNGQLYIESYYIDGILNGKMTKWDYTGKKLMECNYVNGLMEQ